MRAGADIIFGSLGKADIQHTVVAHVLQAFKSQIRVDAAHAIAKQQRHMMHLTRLSRLDNNRSTQTRTVFNQMMVQTSAGQQRRYSSQLLADASIRKDQDALALCNIFICGSKNSVQRLLQACAALIHLIKHRNRCCLKVGDMLQLRQLHIAQHRRFSRNLVTAFRLRINQVQLRPDAARRIGKDLLADSVDRRIRNLRKKLLEIII